MKSIIYIKIIFIFSMFSSYTLWAQKTNQSVYEDPFDQASGGASLTRATQSGMLFANPALLPYGGKFLRWLGLRTTFMIGKDSVDLAKDLINGQGSSASQEGEETGGDSSQQEFIDRVFTSPVHVGSATALSFLTNNGGISLFYRVEPDIKAEKVSDTGLPGIILRSEAYAGAVGSLAIRSPWRSLSFGLSAKYLYASETYLNVQLTDSEAISSLQSDGGQGESIVDIQKGIGLDAGMLYFLQTHYFDLRIAGKIDDFGNTKFTGNAKPQEFKQTVHGGVGLTFHTGSDAIHLSADYRDILGAYEESLFKRVYVGAKVLLRTYIGLAAGYYQGSPSYGVELDLIFLRATLSQYTKELSSSPGVEPRSIYLLSLTSGFDF